MALSLYLVIFRCLDAVFSRVRAHHPSVGRCNGMVPHYPYSDQFAERCGSQLPVFRPLQDSEALLEAGSAPFCIIFICYVFRKSTEHTSAQEVAHLNMNKQQKLESSRAS